MRRKAIRAPAWRLWVKARDRALASGQLFAITEADIEAVWPTDNRCPVLGLALTQNVRVLADSSPTLDRLNNEWGYEAGNIAVLSMRANRLKSNGAAAEHEQVAAWMRAKGLA